MHIPHNPQPTRPERDGAVQVIISWLRVHSIPVFVLSTVLTILVLKWKLISSGSGVTVSGVSADYWIAILILFGSGVLSIRKLAISFTSKTRGTTWISVRPTGRRIHLWVLIAIVFVATEAPLIAPMDPSWQGDLLTTRLLAPGKNEVVTIDQTASLLQPSSSETKYFLLGTDNLGRDVLSRLLYALRISVIIGLSATVLALFLGTSVGLLAGFARQRYLDEILMRIVDLFLAVPPLFLIIAVVAFCGSSIMLLVVVLAGTSWMTVARMVRGEVRKLREREFILVAKMLGRSKTEIIVDHILPNILPTVTVAAMLQLGTVLLAEASLSFLGLGVQPPTPSLGNMIGESLSYIHHGWWVGIFPGLVLVIFLVSVNQIAEGLQEKITTGSGQGQELRQ